MLLCETHVMVKQQTVSDYFENNVIKCVCSIYESRISRNRQLYCFRTLMNPMHGMYKYNSSSVWRFSVRLEFHFRNLETQKTRNLLLTCPLGKKKVVYWLASYGEMFVINNLILRGLAIEQFQPRVYLNDLSFVKKCCVLKVNIDRDSLFGKLLLPPFNSHTTCKSDWWRQHSCKVFKNVFLNNCPFTYIYI